MPDTTSLLIPVDEAVKRLGWSEAEVLSGTRLLRIGSVERVFVEDVERIEREGAAWSPRPARMPTIDRAPDDPLLAMVLDLQKRVAHLESLLRKARPPVSLSLRQEVSDRDQHACRYCGKLLRRYEHNVDHVIPWSQGGATTLDNLVLCCRACNDRKGPRTPVESGMPVLPVGSRRPGRKAR